MFITLRNIWATVPDRKRYRRTTLALEALERRDVPTVFTTAQLHQAAEYMLTIINDIRANPLSEVARTGVDLNEGLAPGTISSAPKQPLAANPSLNRSIAGHVAFWLNDANYWANPAGMDPHNGLGDGTISSRASDQGYFFTSIGENLVWNSQSNDVTDLQSMAHLMVDELYTDSFSGTRGHRLNLLDPNWKEAGAGLASGLMPAGAGAGTNLVVGGQDFGTLDNFAIVTGAVYRDLNANGHYDMGEGLDGTAQNLKITVTGFNAADGTTTTVSDVGAYSIKLVPGRYIVTVSGGTLAQPQSQDVTVSSTNILADLVIGKSPGLPVPGTGVTVAGRQAEFVRTNDGNLWQHTGTQYRVGWVPLWNAGGVTDFSVGVDAGGHDAEFVNFGGQLLEHTGTNPYSGWQLIAGGATSISASIAQANTVFISFGNDLWSYTNGSWAQISRGGVTGFDAALDSNSNAAVFVNFSGQLWFHTGTGRDTGWSIIQLGGVTSFSASQVQAADAFISFGTDVWQHIGLDRNSGWSLISGGGATGFSAGVNASGQAVVFINFSGQLWEHVGTDRNTGWSLIQQGGVTKIRASQFAANAVFVSFGTDFWQHLGTDRNSGWSQIL